jgi:DNA segregation ATPase FtsK/SpoIIIE, S-DNA-T family
MAARSMAKIANYPTHSSPLRILAGLALCLFSSYLLLSLITYNQADPSLNRATGNAVTNAGGYTGALVADLALQIMGLASLLLVMVPIAWGLKMMRGHSVSHLWLRFTLLIISLVLCAGLLSTMEPPMAWPIGSGFGGSIGTVLHDVFYKLFKNSLFIGSVGALALITVSLAFGMSWSEWRTLGRLFKHGLLLLSGIVLSLVARLRSSEEEDEEETAPARAPRKKRLKLWNKEDEDEETEPEAIRQQPRVSKKTEDKVEKPARTRCAQGAIDPEPAAGRL